MQLLIATTNPGKKKEFISLLELTGIALTFPDVLGIRMEVEETGASYVENAILKADALSKLSGLPTLADDTGLEVTVLEGRPGLHSARYAGGVANSDQERRQELLRELRSFPQPWLARFTCEAAIAIPGQPTRTFHGEVAGEIIQQERGEHGFGYDRIFFIPALGKTMAELDLAEKNLYSHRALAVTRALRYLESLL